MSSPTEPTALQRQHLAFAYLRERAINAHVAGDGLLANLLSHTGLDRATRLSSDGQLLLSMAELAWMPILALYWIVSPSARYAVEEWLKKAISRDESDKQIIEWITLYHYLVEQPLFVDEDLFTRIADLPWPAFFAAHSAEAETLLTNIVELAWFRNTGGDGWRRVLENWQKRAPQWTAEFFEPLLARLSAQTKLTAPTKESPVYLESAADSLRSYSPFAELWLLHLQGPSSAVCALVERLTPRVSPDSHDWRVLGDFIHFDGAFIERDESQNVHLARRRRLSADTPLLIFHDGRGERIDDALLQIFRTRSRSNASERWGIFTLAMQHELSALRLWDYGMWVDAIRAQALTMLESMQWTSESPHFAAQGLVLSVRGFAAKDPDKDYLTRGAVDVLEFADSDVLDYLADGLLATYPTQKRGAAELLGDLTDLLRPSAWPELARWTASYARESADSRTHGWTIAPASHWYRALPAVPSDSPVWSILQAEAVSIARISHCWESGEAAIFLDYWLSFAPSQAAREVAATIADHPESDAALCIARAELVISFEEAHDEFRGLFTRALLPHAHSPTEAFLLARHLDEADLIDRETAVRERISHLILETIERATPDKDVKEHRFGMPLGVHLVESWLPADEPLLRALIAAVDSPNILSDYLPWLIQTIQLLVANGPDEFARIVEPAVGRWTTNTPTGRSMFGEGSGPFSTMQFTSDQSGAIRLMVGWLAFQLPRKLGAGAHHNVLTWVRQMLLSRGVEPLEMAIYGSAVVALQAEDGAVGEALSLFETALISLWARSGDATAAAARLASGLRRLSGAVVSESPGVSRGGDTGDAHIERLMPALSRFLPEFAKSPQASLRASVAALLCRLRDRAELPRPLAQLLEALKNDNRARVRFEAVGGWTERRKRRQA